MPNPRTLIALLVCLLAAAPHAAGGISVAEPAASEPQPQRLRATLEGMEWEDLVLPTHVPVPADGAGIGPGSRLLIGMPGGLFACTANWIWEDQYGTIYLGSAGHCFLPSTKVATHGPNADYDPNLTQVAVCVQTCGLGGQVGGSLFTVSVVLGNVTYARQTGAGGDVGNDFGLVEIPPQYHHLIRKEMPVWKGPTQVGGWLGQTPVCHFGHGLGFSTSIATQARMGLGLGYSTSSWTALGTIISGDSGSAIATCGQDGSGIHGIRAAGIITHSIGVPVVGVGTAVGFGTTMSKAVTMAQERGLQITALLPP